MFGIQVESIAFLLCISQCCVISRVALRIASSRFSLAVHSTTMSSTPASLKETQTSPRLSDEGGIDNGAETPLSITPETKPEDLPPEWKPSTRLYVAFLTLAVITLMVALDGTSLSVALPVSS